MRHHTKWSVRALVLVLLWGCSAVPKFHLLEKSELSYPPNSRIKLYIKDEIDLSGNYTNRVQQYELNSVQNEITKILGKADIPFTVDGEVPFEDKIENFFVVVEDSTDADILIALQIEGFDYKRKNEIEDLFKAWAIWGALGVVFTSDDAHGYIFVSCFATERKTGAVIYSFDGAGLSDAKIPHREALSQAIVRSSNELVLNMLRANY